MRNTLLVPIVFITNLIVWVCIVSIFVQLGAPESLITLSTRNLTPLLSNLLVMALYLIPLAIMLSSLNISLFLMRHKSVLSITIPLVFILSAISVFVLIPFSYTVLDRFARSPSLGLSEMSDETISIFSPGYIRTDSESQKNIWYAVSRHGTQVSPLVIANSLTPSGTPALSIYPFAFYDEKKGTLFSDTTVLVTHAGGLDPLVTAGLSRPFFIRSCMKDVGAVLDSFRSVYKNNFTSYLWVTGSFILAVLSLWILCYATSWRLLNLFIVATCFRLLFLCYPYTVGGKLFLLLRRFLPLSVPSNLISPLLYLSISLLFLFIGFFVMLKRKIVLSRSKVTYE